MDVRVTAMKIPVEEEYLPGQASLFIIGSQISFLCYSDDMTVLIASKCETYLIKIHANSKFSVITGMRVIVNVP